MEACTTQTSHRPPLSGPAMNERRLVWCDRACTGLAYAIVVGFVAFFAWSVMEGVSKQSVYTGLVGFWLGAYLLFATTATLVCTALLISMFRNHEPRWKRQAALLMGAWLVTLVISWAWHRFAQTQYESSGALNNSMGSIPPGVDAFVLTLQAAAIAPATSIRTSEAL